MDIEKIIKEYYEQLYAHKFYNLDEMDYFLEGHNLPKLTQEEISNPSRPVSFKDLESIINSFPKQKVRDPDGFTGEFC